MVAGHCRTPPPSWRSGPWVASTRSSARCAWPSSARCCPTRAGTTLCAARLWRRGRLRGRLDRLDLPTARCSAMCRLPSASSRRAAAGAGRVREANRDTHALGAGGVAACRAADQQPLPGDSTVVKFARVPGRGCRRDLCGRPACRPVAVGRAGAIVRRADRRRCSRW